MATGPFFENVIIITGASSGIGRELAIQLARQGAWLVLAARNNELLAEVADQCQRENCQVTVVQTDVGVRSQCENLVKKAVERYGRIDTLINNAGFGMYSRFDELQDIAVIEQLVQVNFMGSVYTTFYALPYLKQSRGRLVGMSSQAGKYPSPMVSGYCASKHAMAGFFDTLRIELRDSGVSVTMMYFGFVRTSMGTRALGADGQQVGDIFEFGSDAISVEQSATLTLEYTWKRRRQYIPLQGKIGLWLMAPFPGIPDRIAIKVLEDRNK